MTGAIPTYELYGEEGAGPDLDILHCETIAARSTLHAGLISPHRHADLFQLFYLRCGEVRMTLDGSEFEQSTPCVIAVPSITVHGFDFTGVDGWVLTMPDVLIERLAGHAPDLQPRLDKPHIVDAGCQDIEALFSRIADEFTDIRPGRLLSIQACLELILVWLARRLLVEREREVAVQSKAAAHARRFRQLVEMGFREQRALDRYAQELGMTTTQLNRVCRTVLGKSALTVIHDRLALEARRALVYTSMSVAEVGYALGFSDPSYFTRFFVRATEIAPSEFRRIQRERLRRNS
jgi:AraC family transcriptional regulator, transcriptional activator of pobA